MSLRTPFFLTAKRTIQSNFSYNTYRAARREYSERYGHYIQQAGQWRMVAYGALAVALLSIIGNWHLARQSRSIPYIVQIDHLGHPLFAGVPSRSAADNPLITRALLEGWIEKTRSVIADPHAQHHYIDFVFAFLRRDSPAFSSLCNWYMKRQPFMLAQKETIDVTHVTAVPIGDSTANSWTVTWQEIATTEDGSSSRPTEWVATITFKRQAISLSDEQSTLNPTGLQITHFSWSQKQ